MDLSLDESQTILMQTFADLLARECPTTLVRDAEESGFSGTLWSRYVELGAAGMGIPEESGGLGMGGLELGLVATRSGQALAPVPFVEVAVAGALLAEFASESGESDAANLVSAIAEEGAIVSFVPRRRHPIAGTSAGARRLVPFGQVATHVIAEDGDEVVLVAAGNRRSTEPLRDVGSGAHALWDLSDRGDASRQVLGRGPEGRARFAHATAQWKLLSAFWLLGLAQRALEIGADYAKERVQFGVAIGGFQAIAHPLADCATRVDGAELLAWEAAWAEEAEPARFEELASMAFAWSAQTAQRTAGISLHTHGGYGFSTEYDIQLYYRRACSAALIGGSAREELPQIAELSIARAEAERSAGAGAGHEGRS